MRRLSLTSWMLIAAGGGIALGLAAPEFSRRLEFLSDLFIRFIQSIIAPILAGVLIRALGRAGSMSDLGRLGWKSVVYFEVLTTIALLLGWFTVVAVGPGEGFSLETGVAAQASNSVDFIETLVPTSIIDAMARGDVLQIVVFCFLFGIACLSLGERAKPIVELADSLAEVSFRYTDYVMYLAPVAVFAAMANTIASGGSGALEGLAKFVGAAWVAQIVFLVAGIGASLALFGVPLRRFVHYARGPLLIGFATTSSAAALPRTLENMQSFGVPKRSLGVVAPLSLVLNMNGSSIHLAMAALFVAQAAGIDLPIEQQVLILLTLKVTSKSVAGVPRANFVILAALFESFGLPMAGLAVLLGIDALIDPVRTVVNVMSHCAAPVVVAKWDGAVYADGVPEPRQ